MMTLHTISTLMVLYFVNFTSFFKTYNWSIANNIFTQSPVVYLFIHGNLRDCLLCMRQFLALYFFLALADAFPNQFFCLRQLYQLMQRKCLTLELPHVEKLQYNHTLCISATLGKIPLICGGARESAIPTKTGCYVPNDPTNDVNVYMSERRAYAAGAILGM